MRFVYPGLGLIAGSILVLEVAFTRVFAIMMWHHLSYMVISIAMLGLCAAGAYLTVRGGTVAADDVAVRSAIAGQLSILSALYGVAVLGALLLMSNTAIDTLAL